MDQLIVLTAGAITKAFLHENCSHIKISLSYIQLFIFSQAKRGSMKANSSYKESHVFRLNQHQRAQ